MLEEYTRYNIINDVLEDWEGCNNTLLGVSVLEKSKQALMEIDLDRVYADTHGKAYAVYKMAFETEILPKYKLSVEPDDSVKCFMQNTNKIIYKLSEYMWEPLELKKARRKREEMLELALQASNIENPVSPKLVSFRAKASEIMHELKELGVQIVNSKNIVYYYRSHDEILKDFYEVMEKSIEDYDFIWCINNSLLSIEMLHNIGSARKPSTLTERDKAYIRMLGIRLADIAENKGIGTEFTEHFSEFEQFICENLD